jgi:hypothetical protein
MDEVEADLTALRNDLTNRPLDWPPDPWSVVRKAAPEYSFLSVRYDRCDNLAQRQDDVPALAWQTGQQRIQLVFSHSTSDLCRKANSSDWPADHPYKYSGTPALLVSDYFGTVMKG